MSVIFLLQPGEVLSDSQKKKKLDRVHIKSQADFSAGQVSL